jgi:hypothetical protein
MRGRWSITANSLNLDGMLFPIVRLTQADLVIPMSNGVQFAYGRQPGQYPPFNSSVPIRKKKKKT